MNTIKYLSFLHRKKEVDIKFNFQNYEIELLDLIAKEHFSFKECNVGTVISQTNIASQATLHKAFKSLVAKKLLLIKTHKMDGRFKNVSLTSRAIARYDELNELMSQITDKKFD